MSLWDCEHVVRHPRDPEGTTLDLDCARCGESVRVTIPTTPPTERADRRAER